MIIRENDELKCVKQNHNHLIINLSIMKKKLLLLNALIFCFFGYSVQAQVMTQAFTGTSFPTGWTQSNTCNSTSSNASWKLTTSSPGYGASGFTDNTGATGSYAMWVDGSSPYPCAVSITTDSIDVSTLTTPSIEFYWAKNNTGTYVGNNVLTCLLYTSPSPRDLSTSRMPSSA